MDENKDALPALHQKLFTQKFQIALCNYCGYNFYIDLRQQAPVCVRCKSKDITIGDKNKRKEN